MTPGLSLAASVVVFGRELRARILRVDDVLSLCRDKGLQAVEVRDEPFLGLPCESLSEEGIMEACEDLKCTASRQGVKLLVASGASLGTESGYERLLRAIIAAEVLQSPLVRVFPPPIGLSHLCEAGKSNWLCAPLAKACEAGVRLCIENTPSPEGSIFNLLNLIDYAERVCGCRPKITFDTGNCWMNPVDPGVAEAVMVVKEHLGYVHLKDVRNQEDGRMSDCGPGSGAIDFACVFQVLRSVGFKGYACLEFDGGDSGEAALERALRHVGGYL